MGAGLVSGPILGLPGAKYNLEKLLYLGSTESGDPYLFITRKEAGLDSLEKLHPLLHAKCMMPGWDKGRKPSLYKEPLKNFHPARWSWKEGKAGLDAAGPPDMGVKPCVRDQDCASGKVCNLKMSPAACVAGKACQTDVDGTSINTLEDLALQLGGGNFVLFANLGLDTFQRHERLRAGSNLGLDLIHASLQLIQQAIMLVLHRFNRPQLGLQIGQLLLSLCLARL